MSKLIVFTSIFGIILLTSSSRISQKTDSINSVIGDISFINKFGNVPTAHTDEILRIKTHLEFVENTLREKDCSGLSKEKQLNRDKMLDLLHVYWINEIFPVNYDHANRKPCFIDGKGRICAVGYLIEQTAGRHAAEKINSKYKYEELMDMDDPLVDDWINQSGLTKRECAMIQPSYAPDPTYNYNYIEPAYGIGTAIFSGINTGFSAINLIQGIKGADKKIVGYISLVTGAGSIVYGIVNIPEDQIGFGGYYNTNEAQKMLSFFNIGMGTTTMVLGGFNLISNCNRKDKTTFWNINQVPVTADHAGYQLSFSKTF